MSEDLILYCNGCSTGVRVYNPSWIDPDLYRCKQCREIPDWDQAETLTLPGIREDTPDYDPTMAAIPF
jgi:hypothetical protein